MAGVVVVALAAGGWLWARHGPDYHEQVGAASGTYPAALGTAPPDAPGRLLRRTTDSYGIVGALSVDEIADRGLRKDGITATDLRTGKTYWRYARDGTDLGPVALATSGGSGGGTAAVWWKDGLLAAVDARSGEVRWRHKIAYGDVGGGSREFADLRVTAGLVLAQSRTALAAYDADGGGHAWTAAPPKGCDFTNHGVFPMAQVVVAAALCGNDLRLVGYDTGRGSVRWQLPEGLSPLLPADDHTLVTASGRHTDEGEVVDVSGATPVTRRWTSLDGHPSVAAGGGIVLCVDNVGTMGVGDRKDGEDKGALEGFGVGDGRRHWRVAPAPGTRFGAPLLAGSRVYVVQQPTRAPLDDEGKPVAGAPYPAQLLVLDAATGRRVHAGALPAVPMDKSAAFSPDPSAALRPVRAAGGVLAVAWSQMFGGATADLTVLAQ